MDTHFIISFNCCYSYSAGVKQSMTTWQSHGFKCLARISPTGIPCGYVGLDRNHPDFEKSCDDIDVEVHGGLNFSGYWEDQHDLLWYIGFDVGHAQDFDYDPALGYTIRPRLNKSLSFVQEETEHLAGQMAERRKQKL
jgi:hypothetical protein